MDLQTLMGDAYKDGITIEEINEFMKGKKLADLSTGQYVDKNKYTNEVDSLKKQLTDTQNQLSSKLTDEEKRASSDAEKDKEIARLTELLKKNTLSTNKTTAISLSNEVKKILSLKEDDKDFNGFIDNIVSDDIDKTSSISTYFAKTVKDAYEKGKKDALKDGLGKFGKQEGEPTNSKGVESLGKRLATSSISSVDPNYYFKHE
jgi:hypothetical protein